MTFSKLWKSLSSPPSGSLPAISWRLVTNASLAVNGIFTSGSFFSSQLCEPHVPDPHQFQACSFQFHFCSCCCCGLLDLWLDELFWLAISAGSGLPPGVDLLQTLGARGPRWEPGVRGFGADTLLCTSSLSSSSSSVILVPGMSFVSCLRYANMSSPSTAFMALSSLLRFSLWRIV